MTTKGTYNRKYYLHRRIKAAGFDLRLEHKHKTISIMPDQLEKAQINKYLSELKAKYSYGVQIINPLSEQP